MFTSKVSHEINMGGFVVKPALQGDLVHNSSHWQAIKKSDGSVADQGPLIDDNNKALAQASALCLMFESGPVPTAGNKFCDYCHQYLLAQDMHSIA